MKPTKSRSPRKSPKAGPTIVKIHAAKTTLSRLIVRVLAGERVVIARDDIPLVELVPHHAPIEHVARARRFGSLRGVVAVTPAFFDPLPPEELSGWGE